MVTGSRGKTRNSTRFPVSCAPSEGWTNAPTPNLIPVSVSDTGKKRFHQITSRECWLQSRPCQGTGSSINSSIRSVQLNYRFPALDMHTRLDLKYTLLFYFYESYNSPFFKEIREAWSNRRGDFPPLFTASQMQIKQLKLLFQPFRERNLGYQRQRMQASVIKLKYFQRIPFRSYFWTFWFQWPENN